MAGQVKVAVVALRAPNGTTGTKDFTKTGFGTPKACIIINDLDNSDDTFPTNDSTVSIGFSDFTNDYCICHQDNHGSAKVVSDSVKSNTASYLLMTNTSGIVMRGTAAAITDGVRVTNTLGVSAPGFMTIIMFGGDDLAVSLDRTIANSSQDGTATITPGTGFDTSLVFFVGADISTEDNIATGINNSFGVCHINAPTYDTFTNRSIGWASDHNNNNGSPSSVVHSDQCLGIITETGGEDWGLEVTAAATNSITITTRATGAGNSMEVYSLALDIDDRTAKVGSVDAPTSGSEWAPSVSLGFTPQYVGLGLTHAQAEGTIETDADGGAVGISSNTGSGEESCHSWYNEDAAAAPNTSGLFRSRAIDFDNDDNTTLIQDHQHSSFDDGGWTYTVNTVNDATVRKWFYWAIEELPEPTPFPPYRPRLQPY